MDNAQAYSEAQSLPSGWIGREQIRNVIAKTPRQANTRSFLESRVQYYLLYQVLAIDQFPGYHKIEIYYDSIQETDVPNKRPRIECMYCLQFIIIVLLTRAAELSSRGPPTRQEDNQFSEGK